MPDMSILSREEPKGWSEELPVARSPLIDDTEGFLVLAAGLLVIVLTLVSIFT